MNTVERIAELERQNEGLREALREARKHIVDWWRPDDSLPPAKSWQFVERLDALLENSPAAADAGALPPIGYLDRFNVFFPQRIPGFELRPIYDRSTAADACVFPQEVIRTLTEAHDCAMKNAIEARIPECGDFGGIAQNLAWVLDELERPTANSAAHQEGGAA